MSDITSAVVYLHERDICHRDIKPENILVHENGHLLLTDFGWAKHIVNDQMRFTVCGTPEYLAPGQYYICTVLGS